MLFSIPFISILLLTAISLWARFRPIMTITTTPAQIRYLAGALRATNRELDAASGEILYTIWARDFRSLHKRLKLEIIRSVPEYRPTQLVAAGNSLDICVVTGETIRPGLFILRGAARTFLVRVMR